MRSKLVAGNWKLHGGLVANEGLLQAVRSMANGLRHAACAVCVPYPYLAQAQSILEGGKAQWGAQDVSDHASGAYTGEVAAGMLAEFGCRYAIVGHSERRTLHGEADALVAAKFAAALGAGLTPILCVGETLAERDGEVTEAVVGRQIDAVVSRCGIGAIGKAVLAYEPVWAIGTGLTASPEQAQAVHAFIRRGLAGRSREVAEQVTILYGGSVKGANAAELFAMPDVDGGLIGGASLIADEFAAICRAADR